MIKLNTSSSTYEHSTNYIPWNELVWSAFKIVMGKPAGKRHFGSPRRRWEDNIRMDLEEIDINAGNWVDSTQDKDYCGCCCLSNYFINWLISWMKSRIP